MFNDPTLLQLLAQDVAEQHRLAAQTHSAPARPAGTARTARQALASYLVRLGLRLDPAAGGGPGAPTRKEARRCA